MSNRERARAAIAKRRRLNADKKRRQRERWRNGESVYRVQLNSADLAIKLLDAGFITVNGGDNHAEVERALQRMLVALISE